jgi:acetyl-CoA carboxylase biotin carboxyl carrier protein
MAEKFGIDRGAVRELAELLDETGLTEIEYQVGTQRIRVGRTSLPTVAQKESAPPPPPPASTPVIVAVPAEETPRGEAISSPMVGTAYLSSSPEAAPFIKVGDTVKKGDTLLIVEAMKVMNPIRAPRDGKILEVCVNDATPVEFGEPLIVLE